MALVGTSYPFRKGATAFPQPSTRREVIRNSIQQICGITPGERVMRPEFGSRPHRYIFDSLNPSGSVRPGAGAALRHELSLKLSRFEPRITVLSIDVQPATLNGAEESPNALVGFDVTIRYQDKAGGEPDSLTIPISPNETRLAA
jgi:phage baseplate assembly protein W